MLYPLCFSTILLAAFSGPSEASTLLTRNNSTSPIDVRGYVSDPDGRGTSSLVISCLLTLILCVWSALHLNVPRYGSTNGEMLLLNIQWITAGIYAPELVVFTAWRQWSSARLLSKTISEHSTTESSAEKGLVVLRNQWTTTHSFFASTGGFVIDCGPFLGTILPKDAPKRLTLTARGVKFLAQHGIIPDVPEEDIDDKSKADALAKTMVLIQAAWMMMQVIGRLIAHLPVTLLEVNTVAHVICALSMYIMWWKKPLLAKAPIIVSSPLLPDLVPLMYATSSVSGRIDRTQMKSQTAVKTMLAYLKLYTKVPEVEYLCFREGDAPGPEVDPLQEASEEVENPSQRTASKFHHSSVTTECRAARKAGALVQDSSIAFFERKPQVRVKTAKYFDYDQSIVLRAEKVAMLFDSIRLQEDPQIKSRSHELRSGGRCWHIEPEELLAVRSANFPNDELLRSVDGLVVGIVLWLANFIYGGIHLAAWNDHFPSIVEQWMWRGSAAYIAFCGGLWVCLNAIVRSYQPLNDFWERWMDGEKGWFQNLTLGALVFVCGSSLVVARVYIVIEAFVSIRQLPAAAYDTPEWSQIFPHF